MPIWNATILTMTEMTTPTLMITRSLGKEIIPTGEITLIIPMVRHPILKVCLGEERHI